MEGWCFRVSEGRPTAWTSCFILGLEPMPSAKVFESRTIIIGMDCDSSGIPVVLNQLELPFDGLPSSTCSQRVSAWLEDQNEETEDVVCGHLFLVDAESRRRRAARWMDVRAIQARFHSDSGWLIPGGVEAVWLYEEACRSYMNGMYMAALLCSHSSCERVLAASLDSHERPLSKGWAMWGLGRLVPAAFELGLIDEGLKDRLLQLSELRKVSAHFKPPLSPNSITRRAIELFDLRPELETEDGFDALLQMDAHAALDATTELLRGEQGFSRVGPYRA